MWRQQLPKLRLLPYVVLAPVMGRNKLRRRHLLFCLFGLLVCWFLWRRVTLVPRETRVTRDTHDPKTVPIVLWWTDLTQEDGKVKRCGDVSCFFTIKRTYKDNERTKMFMYYGSNFELNDLPLPRGANHMWALLHEESPQNNWIFSNEKIIRMFNYTSTFKRVSDYPLTLQWLESLDDITSKKYLVSVEEKNRLQQEEDLAPIAYVQKDCNAPSDRDNLVRMLQEHVKVDSYGDCLHNKEFPNPLMGNGLNSMDRPDFYQLLAKYKFVIAMENAVCDDYITEKLWRPYYIGSVPIVYGSPKIKDFLPSPSSAIVVQDYPSVQALVRAITHLNDNDDAYREATSYKSRGISNPTLLNAMKEREWSATRSGTNTEEDGLNHIDGFECYVCRKAWEVIEDPYREPKIATVDHYGCPRPHPFGPAENLHERIQGHSLQHSFWDQIYGQAQESVEEFLTSDLGAV